MAESTIDAIRPISQAEINTRCTQLAENCRNLLINYGSLKTPSFTRKIAHALNNFGTDPTKLPTGKFTSVDKNVFVDGKRTRVQIMDIDGQLQILQGEANGERLVMQGEAFWIQNPKQSYRDINEPSAPPTSTRQVKENDLMKYQEVFALTRNSLIHGV